MLLLLYKVHRSYLIKGQECIFCGQCFVEAICGLSRFNPVEVYQQGQVGSKILHISFV